MTDYYQQVILDLLFSLPIILIWMAGIVLSTINWKRHSQASLFTLMASVLLLLVAVIRPFMFLILRRFLAGGNWTAASYTNAIRTVGFGLTLVSALGYILLLIAIFRWRDAPRRNF